MNEFRERMLTEIYEMYGGNLFEVDEIALDVDTIKVFVKEMEELLTNIIEFQGNCEYKITNIFLIFSRNNIENEVLKYKVCCYGEMIYIDKLEFEYLFDVSYIFKEFVKTKSNIPKVVRKYVKFDVEEGIKESNKFITFYNFIIVKVLREVMKDEKVLGLLEKINKNDEFYIIVGEIYEKPYLIYEYKN